MKERSEKKLKSKKGLSKREVQISLENKILLGAIIIGMIFAIVLIRPEFIGFFVAEEGTARMDLNISVDEGFEEYISLEERPTSIRLSGVMSKIGNGTAEVYLETPTALYLIFDEEYISQEGSVEITALVVADKDEKEKKDKKNKTEKEDAGTEGFEEEIEEEIEAEVNETQLDLILINQTEVNVTETEVVEVNETIIEETEEEAIRTITFESVCRETCSLTEVSDRIKIKIEVENATLNLTELIYTYAIENITNIAPRLIKNISNVTIEKDGNYTFDLGDYFTDEDNDPLIYSATSVDNVSVYIDDSLVTLEPEKRFIGVREVRFVAYDGKNSTFSNNVKINVIEPINVTRPARNESTIQIFAEIGRPVRFVKNVRLNESTVNLTVNISARAQNISVKKIVDGQEIDVDERNVKVRLNETERELEGIGEEEEIGDSLITGAAVGVREGRGLLSRVFGFGDGGITGGAVVDVPMEVMNVSIEISAIENAEIVIEENVTEVEVEYYTPGPEAIEENVSRINKTVTVTSELPYFNILTYTDITETHQSLIKIYWYVNESEYNSYNGLPVIGAGNESLNLSSDKRFKLEIGGVPELYVSYLDLDNNSLIDRVQWITPHLSNQTFEINIKVLDVQSYPVIGGNWSVRFLTAGTANLSIIGINGTTYTEVMDDDSGSSDDLEILSVRCGNNTVYDRESFSENVSFILKNGSVVLAKEAVNRSVGIKGIKIKDYSCDSTGDHTVRVITPGVHNQMFVFGDYFAYANNLAQYPPVRDVIRFADGNLTASYYFLNP